MIKNLAFVFCSLIIFNGAVNGQAKEKATKKFVAALNDILDHSSYQHWAYEGKMIIDSPFAVNAAGILSVSVHYKNDTSIARVHIEAPLNKSIGMLHDLYFIIEFNGDVVMSYESADSNTPMVLKDSRNYFHIGAPENNYGNLEKLQKLWQEVHKYYP